MPSAYLVSRRFAVPIKDSVLYRGRWQVMGKELYVDKNCTQQIRPADSPIPLPPPSSCNAAYVIQDDDAFHDFLNSWMDGSLVLYRGFPGCHFSWPDLKDFALLKSEGDEDKPEFTMNQHGRGSTRWLPTADRNMAQGVTLQCCDPHTQALSMSEPVPIGFTVQIPAGSHRNLPLCWLNAGEIVVRGPLEYPKYRMCSITWMDLGTVAFHNWPLAVRDVLLPPQRPFQPGTRKAIDDWWESCQPWVDLVALYDPVIAAAAARRVAAAAVRAGRRNMLAGILQLPTVP
jgi:hypothetical protein